MVINVFVLEDMEESTVIFHYHIVEVIPVRIKVNVSKFPDLLNANVKMVGQEVSVR